MRSRKAHISMILWDTDQFNIFSILNIMTLNPSDEMIYPRNLIFSMNNDDFLIDMMISIS
jgi:hypothetical protein